MLRVLGLFALVAGGVTLALMGGQIGPLDLAQVPLPMVAFAAATILVLLGLRHI